MSRCVIRGVMPVQRFIASAVAIVFVFSACSDNGSPPSAVSVVEEHGSGESPLAVPTESDDDEPPLIVPFLERVRSIDIGMSTVVLATVRELSVSERSVPNSVWPEQGVTVVTKATIVVEDVFCGPSLTGNIDMSYIGGESERMSLRTSLMTEDVNVGQTYVFLVTEVDGEVFLVGGSREFLSVAKESKDAYTDFEGRELTAAELGEACP